MLELARNKHKDSSELDRIESIYQQVDLEYLLKEVPEALLQSKSGMAHIKNIVLAMKGYSHPGTEKISCSLNETISNAIVIATSEWKYVAKVVTDYDENLPLVKIIPSRIKQVILNLVTNASHAIDDVITEGELGEINIKTSFEKSHVRINVSDTGAGISKDVIGSIFDPFFTTKEVGEGTGQGLSIVHKIITEDHNGKIMVESKIDEGTCFTIVLPINGLDGLDGLEELDA